MPDLRRLIREIHRRSLWQVLTVYVVSSWLILQFVDTLAGALNLPSWASPLALFLLIVGLPIVLATAFVQEGAVPADADRAATRTAASDPGGRASSHDRTSWDELRQQLTWPRALLGGVVAFSLLFGVAGLVVLLGDDGRTVSTDPAETADPAVAVLPFTVRGLDLEVWREGMVDLLSPMIDGVEGLRAINARTVLARWSERVGDGDADLETSLEVARGAGGRFALIGSAVATGPTVRIELELHDTATGERLAAGRVEGSASDMMALTDGAATEAARAVLESLGKIPDFELERMTESAEARMAFLEGEVAFREYRLVEARNAYERAVAVDSAFAFAHLRLAEVAQWGATYSARNLREHREAAARHVDRLTERSRMRVRAAQASGVERQEILRDAVSRYPDDAILWYELGEALIHTSAGFPGFDEIRGAFNRALELEPNRAANYPHVVSLAFQESADTARTRRLADAFLELAGNIEGAYAPDADPRIGPFMFDLMFGSPSERAAAVSALDTLPPDFLLGAGQFAWNPRRWEAFEPVNLALIRHPGAGDSETVFGTMLASANRRQMIAYALWRGQPERALQFASGENLALGPGESPSRGLLYHLHALDIPVPGETLTREFGAARIDSTSDPETVFLGGAFAADEERWDDHESAIRELERRGSADARREVLEAYGIWRRGDVESAIPVFEQHHPRRRLVQWWLGDAYLEAGHFEDAERVFSSYAWNQWYTPFSREPLAQQRLGRIYEALGRPDDAANAYAYFLEDWENAEPALQPLVEDTRRRLEAIVDERG